MSHNMLAEYICVCIYFLKKMTLSHAFKQKFMYVFVISENLSSGSISNALKRYLIKR